jgi:hypothetical protein
LRKQAAAAERDRKAYDLAWRYLLDLPSAGVTEELLQHYLNPPSNRDTPNAMADVFRRLLESAQNRGMMTTVIGGSIGGVAALGPMLGGFSPTSTIKRFASSEELLDAIKLELRPVGKFRRGRGSLWPLFARAALSGAQFLSQFDSGPEFIEWVRVFDADDRKRAALPMLLSQEIDGFGFALACDFLKELGFLNFAKPDVHVKAVVKGLQLSGKAANDYAVFKAVVRIASSCGKTPYAVDKLFWLVGSGRFYDHPEMGKKGLVRTDRDGFVRRARRVLASAA